MKNDSSWKTKIPASDMLTWVNFLYMRNELNEKNIAALEEAVWELRFELKKLEKRDENKNNV